MCLEEPAPYEAFTIAVARPCSGVRVLHLSGELDLLTATVLDAELDEVLTEQGTVQVIVNMSWLSFCGLAALASLLRAQRRAHQHHITLSLVTGPRWQRLSAVLGLTDQFPTYPDLARALAAARAATYANPKNQRAS